MKIDFRYYSRQFYLIPTILIDFDLKEINIYWLNVELNFDFWK